MALLYALGAHGIMTLNDFKALEGDRQHGVRSLPVTLGPEVAAKVACTVMGLAQALVIAMLLVWGKPWHALAVTACSWRRSRRCACCCVIPKPGCDGTTARGWSGTSQA